MDLHVENDQFTLSLYDAKVVISGYVGCTLQSMLRFFLRQTSELNVNRNLTLRRNDEVSPSTYHFVTAGGVRTDIRDSDALNFLSRIGEYVKA